MINRFFLIFGTVSLLSCSYNGAPPKEPYNLKYEFTSDKNYQYVYRLILNKSDTCMKHVGLSKSISEGRLYSDIKAGDINIMQQSALGKYPHIKVKIEGIDNGSKVNVTNDFEKWDEYAKSFQSWVEDESDMCR